jgi:hypothetical protein
MDPGKSLISLSVLPSVLPTSLIIRRQNLLTVLRAEINKIFDRTFAHTSAHVYQAHMRTLQRVGINEIFDRASVLTAPAHQARMSILEFCRLTKNGAHEQSILVTYINQ